MTELTLRDCSVLVVEDEYLVAECLEVELAAAGAVVLGPVARVADALALLELQPKIDAAILDVNLQGEMVFPVADALTERSVPFIFTSGYDRSAVPKRFEHVLRYEKPADPSALAMSVKRLIRTP